MINRYKINKYVKKTSLNLLLLCVIHQYFYLHKRISNTLFSLYIR
jgi:hypothetical protein